MDLKAYLHRRYAARQQEDQRSLQQTGQTVSQRRAEVAEDEDERFTRAWCAKHRMAAEDVEAYVRMDIDERARWRRDNPEKWRTSRIALALAARRSGGDSRARRADLLPSALPALDAVHCLRDLVGRHRASSRVTFASSGISSTMRGYALT